MIDGEFNDVTSWNFHMLPRVFNGGRLSDKNRE